MIQMKTSVTCLLHVSCVHNVDVSIAVVCQTSVTGYEYGVLNRRSKEQELQQVQRGWSAASQQEGSHNMEAQRAKQQVKALEGQLRNLHSRLTTLQADTRC